MKQSVKTILVLFSFALIVGCKPTPTFTIDQIALVPQVQKIEMGESSFKFKKSTKIVVANAEQEAIAKQFAGLFAKSAGWEPEVVVGGSESSNQLYFKDISGLPNEGYTLVSTKDRIEVSASSPAGFFYATQTLRQLLPAEIESTQTQSGIDWVVPSVNITDGPAFNWRGYMLDVSRHFFPKDDVISLIDKLALHKINTLHLHLVDDQGWRIEIKKYPKLTEIGAWRVDHEDKHWNSRPKQQPGEKATNGGFYTQEDIKEIVKYAQAHYITVVPEIEMPAHVTSALAAYPQLSCTGGPFTVPTGGLWPITDIYCAGNDMAFTFNEDVLTEVFELFPSKYIHVGGDEATKTEWEKCPKCRKRIQTEKLKNVGELQSYFMKRMEKFINQKGKILLGWDEILEGGLPAEATVMSWRGTQGGIEAAKQGHNVVMTPNSFVYFDYYQGPMDQEPLAIGGYLPLSSVYKFSPVPSELTADEAKHILGGQANLWTEYVPNYKHIEYMTFPRVAALAEVVWSPKEVQGWDDFSRRVQTLMKRYGIMGINYSKSSYKVTAKSDFDTQKKQLAVSLKGELTGVEIHYTTDGSEPDANSPKYESPIILDHSATVKAVSIANGVPAEKAVSQIFNLNKATVKPVKYAFECNKNYQGSGNYTLVNSIRGSANHADGEWQGWSGDNMDVVIDLQQQTEVSKISVGSLQNPGSWIFFPRKVEFFVSTDGAKFQKVGETVTDTDPLAAGNLLKDYTASFSPVNVGFVRVVAHNIGKAPKGHQGAGQPAWLFIDEIAVE